MSCSFVKEDGMVCGSAVESGSNYCKQHSPAVLTGYNQKIALALLEAMNKDKLRDPTILDQVVDSIYIVSKGKGGLGVLQQHCPQEIYPLLEARWESLKEMKIDSAYLDKGLYMTLDVAKREYLEAVARAYYCYNKGHEGREPYLTRAPSCSLEICEDCRCVDLGLGLGCDIDMDKDLLAQSDAILKLVGKKSYPYFITNGVSTLVNIVGKEESKPIIAKARNDVNNQIREGKWGDITWFDFKDALDNHIRTHGKIEQKDFPVFVKMIRQSMAIINTGKPYVLTNDLEGPTTQWLDPFLTTNKRDKLNIGGRNTNLGELLYDIKMRELWIYAGMQYSIVPVGKNILNLFRGFQAKELPVKGCDVNKYPHADSLRCILDHIRVRLCNIPGEYDYQKFADGSLNHRTDVFAWFIKWLAFMVRSNEKPSVASMFISSIKGIGKTIFFEWLAHEVIGKANTCVSSTLRELMNADFNSHFSNKRLVLVNEVGSDTFNHELFKSRITDKQVLMSKKFVDTTSIISNECYILCSNKIDHKFITCGDRRMCVIGCLEEKISEFEITRFKKCRSECADDFITFLMNVDISSYQPYTFPVTELKKEIIESNLSLENQFCSYFLINGKMKRSDTYAAYVKWLGDEKMAGRVPRGYEEVGVRNFISAAGNIRSKQSNGKHYYELIGDK